VKHLTLGTAQWGQSYGITNVDGRLSDKSIVDIMAVAEGAGISSIDTAANYGDAQERLRPWSSSCSITTKIAAGRETGMSSQIRDCLRALDVESVSCVLLHDWESAESVRRARAVSELGEAIREGLVQRVGVSIYTESGLKEALDVFDQKEVHLGCVQIPANPLDRRLTGSDFMAEVASGGTRVQVRSVFLQGLLAFPSTAPFSSHSDVVNYFTWVHKEGLSPVQAALNHVRALADIDEIIVGVTSAAELQQIVQAWDQGSAMLAPPELESTDIELLDPRGWR
jgi:aryl-alcohol dehydrogenase-like predicted oxidoreductase